MAEQTIPSAGKSPGNTRHWVQGGFLFAWLWPVSKLHGICGPVFQCYSCPLATFACPIGVIANFSALHVFPFLAVGILVAVGALVGSFVCGWACPFGFFQDMLDKIPFPKFKLPRWTGFIRYAVLVGLVLVIPFLYGVEHPLFICSVCPVGALEAAAPDMAGKALAGISWSWPSTAKIVITVLVVVAIFFTARPWCRLFCPLGAIYGLFNRVSVFFLKFKAKDCIDCGLCRKTCRYGVNPDLKAHDSRCIRCLECMSCPTAALQPSAAFSKDKPSLTGDS